MFDGQIVKRKAKGTNSRVFSCFESCVDIVVEGFPFTLEIEVQFLPCTSYKNFNLPPPLPPLLEDSHYHVIKNQ